jgi:putative transposase
LWQGVYLSRLNQSAADITKAPSLTRGFCLNKVGKGRTFANFVRYAKINNMPNKERQFINDEIYHIFNRGIEKRDIFIDESDYYRFIFSLYECNDLNYVVMRNRIGERRMRSRIGKGATFASLSNSKRGLLVEVIVFTLMPNHYHLIVRQLRAGGISLFMKKLSNSYTGYFNGKHERTGMGGLFQGRFKAVHVEGNNQFMHLVEYVFSNPVELADSDWKIRGAKDPKKAIEFLNDYKWSSYLDSIGSKNFPSVTEREFLWKVFSGSKDIEKGKQNVKKFTEEWIKNKKSLFAELTLE